MSELTGWAYDSAMAASTAALVGVKPECGRCGRAVENCNCADTSGYTVPEVSPATVEG